MAALSAERKEAIRLLLKSILTASIAGARAMERHIVGGGATGKLREELMNAVCTELLSFHLWRALRLARQLMPAEQFELFTSTATQGLAVAAAGIFTGLYDKNAQKLFLQQLQGTFARYNQCTPEVLVVRDPLTSTDPVGTLSRSLAEKAGRPNEDGVILQAFVVASTSVNTAQTDAHVAAVVKAA